MSREVQYFFRYVFGCCFFRNFYVVVVPLKRTSETVKNLKNPDEMDIEEVGDFFLFQCVVLFRYLRVFSF